MVGIGETYLPAFVLALSASHLASGLVLTVPLLAGAILQLVSPRMVRRDGAYRRWVVCCAAMQAAAFVPLLIGALLGVIPVLLVFAVAAVYWAAGMASGAAWFAWVETLVPQRLQARYFARRSLVGQWGVMAGFVLGGVVLQAAAGSGYALRAFALLFLVAALARFLSASLLRRQREPMPPGSRLSLPPLGKLVASLVQNTNGPVLAYLLLSQAAVQVAGPYFTPFMLGHLALSYYQYVILICAASIARIALLPAWGWVVDRYGPQRVLWLSAIGIIPLPALWLLSRSFALLIGVQVLSGVIWGAYDLATLLLFFEAIPSEKRLGVLTVFNLANAGAVVAGSAVGGVVLAVCSASREAYLALFVISAVARAAALVLLVRVPRLAVARSAAAETSVATASPSATGLASASSSLAPHLPGVRNHESTGGARATRPGRIGSAANRPRPSHRNARRTSPGRKCRAERGACSKRPY